MKNYLCLLFSLFFLSKAYAITPNPAQKQPVQPSFDIKAWVVAESIQYGVNPELSECIISHESQWVTDKTGPEKRGASEGLWQIYLLMHKEVTKSDADNPIFATQWALTAIKGGHVGWWTTYGRYCSDIPVFL